MDELKNLMIQTLETNGILGQLRAQIRCSVFKIIDNQDEMENPKMRGKSALHWENAKAREVLSPNLEHAVLLAELIREYLEFYRLDYTKQIFMPETNLLGKKQSSQEELASKSGLDANDLDSKKPLLLQILENFKQGRAANQSPMKSNSSPAPGINFSDIKNKDAYQPLSVGEGILGQPAPSPPKDSATEKHLEKANSLLDELSREERSGYKAELISGMQQKNTDSASDQAYRYDPSPSRSGSGSPETSFKKQAEKKKSDDDIYEEEFEDMIEEDIPEIEQSGDRLMGVAGKIGESHGITVSQSLGIDPSVDSLALEDYDHIEPVDKIQ